MPEATEATPTPEDAAAAKKREENRKKRERQKAKKKAEAAAGTSHADRWKAGKLPGGRAERRNAGPGRGMGVFAVEQMPAGELISSGVPALSVAFDDVATNICTYCFADPPADATTESEVALKTAEGGGYGIVLDDHTPPGASEAVALVTCVTKDSPNRGAVRIGDRVVCVQGERVSDGKDATVRKLLEAAKTCGEGGVSCTVARPELLVCQGCKKAAVCAKCVAEGRMAWHAYECKAMQAMPAQFQNTKETSMIRMLLRYKMCTDVGEWHEEKEPISMLNTLQGNATDVPPDQLQILARMTGVPNQTAASLIYQVRTNACEMRRCGGKKAACALSCLMGWHNHDCTPNAKAEVREDGHIALTTLRDIKAGEEITISCASR
jgi:hypothetical protein